MARLQPIILAGVISLVGVWVASNQGDNASQQFFAGISHTANSNCDPNYAGRCVPIASDVDCAGGNGNGPAYVRGPVRVVGRDIYHLDRDGDGIGCEPYRGKR